MTTENNVAAVVRNNAAVIDAAITTPGALSGSADTGRTTSIDPELTGSGLKCQCFPHGVHGVIIVFLSTMAWLA